MLFEKQPVRILHVVTYMGRGGIETMLMNYYRHADKTKIQFDFLVHREFRADYDDEIEAMGGRIYRIPPMNPFSPHYRNALKSFFQNHTYRIVHCHLNYMSGVILSEAKHADVPIRIAHAHNTSAKKDVKYLVRKLYALSIPQTATNLFACSTAAGQAIFGLHPFHVMPNAIDASAFRFSASMRKEKRAELGLTTQLAIINVGRFHFQKNHTFLISAFSELLKTEPNARLLLVGDGPLHADLRRQASVLPENAVMFLGVRKDIPDLLCAADIFAFPSHYEGLPVTLIEAQAAGLPCIKSTTITNECVVSNLVTSLPIENPVKWAEEIYQKKDSPRRDQYDVLIKSGYDIYTAAKKLENFYLNGEPL